MNCIKWTIISCTASNLNEFIKHIIPKNVIYGNCKILFRKCSEAHSLDGLTISIRWEAGSMI